MTMIELPPRCDRAAAAALQPELVDAMADEPTLIDASKVERIGMAMLQLLVCAANTGGGISLAKPSRAFCETVSLANLQAILTEKDAA